MQVKILQRSKNQKDTCDISFKRKDVFYSIAKKKESKIFRKNSQVKLKRLKLHLYHKISVEKR